MTLSIDDKIDGVLGLRDNVTTHGLTTLHEKISALLELRDNPVVGVAGQFSQQQPSAALPQLSEALTQLASKQVQEELAKSTAVSDPLEAELDRKRKQLESLKLDREIAELTAAAQQQQQQAAQMPQGAPAGMPPDARPGTPPTDPTGQYGTMPMPGGPSPMPGGGTAPDMMAQLRHALGIAQG